MIKTINVLYADGLRGELILKTTGATKIRYKMLFHEELDKEIGKFIEKTSRRQMEALRALGDGNVDAEMVDAQNTQMVAEMMQDGILEVISRAGYVMARTGQNKADQINSDDYFAWLDTLSSFEIESHAADIIACYYSMKESDIDPKKESAPQSES